MHPTHQVKYIIK